ncbi:MAG: epoxyqueuosine reductase QueH [Clostridiales Family XIII bacterium]|jgi:predicted adenine nucleotide alpha hydrolase (AANH) superfamily ATPase|nr:epoxyqueuosine reductase QueH [Clostridiales Family XIII bacterium]
MVTSQLSFNNNNKDALSEYGEELVRKPAIAVHSCCGPCSTAVAERLARRFRITLYFCNPNIDDEAEYKRRFSAQRAFVRAYNTSPGCPEPIELVAGPYTPAAFLKHIEGFESAPEGGLRCRICIKDRLEATAAFAAMNGFEYFTTTLSVSPHKNYEMILALGREIAVRYALTFLAEDFKKQDGYKRSIELSKAYCLYRQQYCGCRFSKSSDGGI